MSIKLPLFVKNKNSKSCDGCTKCCDGWLSANILGEDMYPGKACRFVEEGVGCTIYKDRPESPCKQFQCFWRASEVMPEEFKPSETNTIIINNQIDGIPFLSLVEAGDKVKPELLSWFLVHCFENQLNMEWQIGDRVQAMGSREFHEAIQRRIKRENRETF